MDEGLHFRGRDDVDLNGKRFMDLGQKVRVFEEDARILEKIAGQYAEGSSKYEARCYSSALCSLTMPRAVLRTIGSHFREI
jgi:hypothetical protein